VDCDVWAEAISALADGEDPGIDPRLVQAHLGRCPSCRAFRDQLEQVGGAPPRREVPVMPDLSRRVVRLNALADRASHWSAARLALAVVAVQIVVLAVPDLVDRGADGSRAHDSRHLGAFSVAYAVGLLVVVARPARARTVLPVAVVLAGALGITAVVDIARGDVPLVGESLHLPELVSVLLVWLLAVPADRWRRARQARPAAQPALRLVDDGDGPARAAQ
jgi:predicted anti-sigma-YlaC factor YlaD